MKTALIIGSTGLIGGQLLDLLLESDRYEKVIALVKRSTEKTHPKLQEFNIDFDTPDSYKHLVKGDDLFCTIGTTIKKAGSQEAFRKVDYEYPFTIAQLAKANHFKQCLIVSSLGAQPQTSNFYLKTKGEVETALEGLNFDATIIVRPSLLLGNRSEFRLGEIVGAFFMKLFSFVLLGKLKRYRAIDSAKVAKALYVLAQKQHVGLHRYESEQLQEIGA